MILPQFLSNYLDDTRVSTSSTTPNSECEPLRYLLFCVLDIFVEKKWSVESQNDLIFQHIINIKISEELTPEVQNILPVIVGSMAKNIIDTCIKKKKFK